MNLYRSRTSFFKSRAMAIAVTGLLTVAVPFAGGLAAASAAQSATAMTPRSTVAITYPEGRGTSVDIVGTTVQPDIEGKAEVKRAEGRTRVKLEMGPLPHPQSLGPFFTTYLLWAVAPEGQAESLAELPHSKDVKLEATTSLQTFGLIVTAEPHSAVRLPSPVLMAENTTRRNTKGQVQAGNIEYSSATGELYLLSGRAASGQRDHKTPLLVLGARRAVDMARDAGAAQYAAQELREAELKLAAVEKAARRKRELPRDGQGMARDAMRIAEHARMQAIERREQARLAAERRAQSASLARAESEAERARRAAERARLESERDSKRTAEAQQEAALAKERAALARSEAERARTDEARARLQAEQSRLDAEQARRERAEMQERLFQSLSAILETRREARGLIVSLSDVLFDFDRASLKPGAREKLSKLAGILLAYPGKYRIEIEGHTDSVGSHAYNMTLSQDRAESVHGYLLKSGMPNDRVGSATGFGETRPVASNDNAAGRQMNRRVEIVISDLDER